MKSSFFILLFILCFSSLVFAEKQVKMKTGNVYQGEVISETESEIRLQTRDGITMQINRSQIESISNAKVRIVTKSWKIYIGELIEETENFVKVSTSEGVSIDIPKNQIVERGIADLESEAKQQEEQTNRTAYYENKYNNQQRYSRNYKPMYAEYMEDHDYLGVTLLFPGGINLVFAKTTETIGFRLQGGYIGTMYGFSGNLLINIRKTQNFDINVGFCAGYTALEETKSRNYYYDYSYSYSRMGSYTYAGGTFDFNYNGLFAELGVVIGEDDYYSEDFSEAANIFAIWLFI